MLQMCIDYQSFLNGRPFQTDTWTLKIASNCTEFPLQYDSYSCGVYVCFISECFLLEKKFYLHISSSFFKVYRSHMLATLIKHSELAQPILPVKIDNVKITLDHVIKNKDKLSRIFARKICLSHPIENQAWHCRLNNVLQDSYFYRKQKLIGFGKKFFDPSPEEADTFIELIHKELIIQEKLGACKVVRKMAIESREEINRFLENIDNVDKLVFDVFMKEILIFLIMLETGESYSTVENKCMATEHCGR